MGWRLRKWLGILFTVTLVALSVRLLVVDDYRVSSESMYPSLWDGDFILVSKFNFNIHFPFSSYEVVHWRHPNRAEIVMFSLPDHGAETFVKRVVAIEGDRVAIQNGILLINGIPAGYQAEGDSKDLYREAFPGQSSYAVKWAPGKVENYGPVDIPPGYFFVLGDNRLDATDSRTWGPIPYACLKGKLAMVWLSLEPDWSLRWRRLGLWVKS